MTRTILSVFGLIASVAACAAHAPPAPVASVPTGPPARVDIGRALVHHPFAAVLAQYDVDIATLRDTAGTAAFADLDRHLAASSAAIGRDLARAAGHVANLRTQPIGSPLPGPADSRQTFGSGTLASFRQALQHRLARAHELRASQLREREANAALDFERAHAGERLVLDVKLRNLHLEAATRTRYRARVAALDAGEEAVVEAERRRSYRVLAAYDAQLSSRAVADAAAMSADVANGARGMQSVPQPLVSALPPSIAAGRDQRPATLSAFAAARRDLTERFGQLRTMDRSARNGARAELVALQRERDELRAEIVASIEVRARRIATSEGLGRLYFADAPRGARDITNLLVK